MCKNICVCRYRRSKGFTLIELTIVLALLAIVAAILIPTFMNTTDRARLRSDIQSARVIQNAIELHNAERVPITATDITQILSVLTTAGYLEAGIRATDIQSVGAVWEHHSTLGIIVNISRSPDNVRRAYTNLNANERRLVIAGSGAPITE